MIVAWNQSNSLENYLIFFEILFSCKLFLLISIYVKEGSEIEQFNTKMILSVEIQKTEDLLQNLMPVHVIDHLKEGLVVAEELEDVPIMFADIVGFTAFSSLRSPKEVIKVLNQLFSKFDALCVQNCCYKVCTIGDCYLAIGYNGVVNKEDRNVSQEVIHMTNFCFGLIEAIQEVNQLLKSRLQMRIGIHVGNIIGGVSGSNIVRYDIYGPAVMIANTMESNGSSGQINISKQTKHILENATFNYFTFDFNQTVNVQLTKKDEKIIMPIDCFFVNQAYSSY